MLAYKFTDGYFFPSQGFYTLAPNPSEFKKLYSKLPEASVQPFQPLLLLL